MENKKTKIVGIVAIIALALTVISATYAYFTAQVGDPAAADIKINANTVDTFTFATGSQISFSINQDNFASGAGNQTGSTYASAKLTANNKTNTATEHYYLYLNIENNTFTYSIDENTPEIIMTVKDSSGTEVTDISTLNHVIVTGANNTQVSGYDITNKSGLITLFNNREITTTSSKEEKWNITITFVNYDENQNANAGKSMSANVMIQKEQIKAFISDVCSSNNNLVNCLITLGDIGNLKFTNLYHHDGTLANGINDGSYRYAGASDAVNNFICLGTNTIPCPDANLFRIIGLFGDQVKVIRAKPIGGYMAWDSNGSNTWSTSSLNTYLKETYLPSLGTLTNKIATTTWKVGGNEWANVGNAVPATAYQNEIVNPDPGDYSTTGETEYSAKIGLMYANDYGFAAAPSAWSKTLNNYDGNDDNGVAIKTINWLYIGSFEWTISRMAGASDNESCVITFGNLSFDRVMASYEVRPSLYLLSSVAYAGGIGTSSDPILIN